MLFAIVSGVGAGSNLSDVLDANWKVESVAQGPDKGDRSLTDSMLSGLPKNQALLCVKLEEA